MNEQASFSLRGRNPDILSCIANLSNDEVFTPPELANRMLDAVADAWAEDNGGADLFTNKSVKFLDPFTKSGVFLREIARRLTIGLAGEIPNLQERVDHILTQQVYGIGITHLTSLLARRSVYCSKTANGEHSIASSFENNNGNIWFERIEHTWENGKCIYCGATKEILDRSDELETYAYPFIHTDDIHTFIKDVFGENMQFDVIIGNPPYQLSDGGYGTSAAPIYQKFVMQAQQLEPRFLSMVIPSRWFTGGRNLDEFRERMINDEQIRVIEDYLSASEVFQGVGLKGGVCYFLWQKDSQGPCSVSTHFKNWPVSQSKRMLRENGAETFIRFNEGVSILRKVGNEESINPDQIAVSEDQSFSRMVSSLRPFGFRTFFRGRKSRKRGDLKIYQRGGQGFVARSEVKQGQNMIDTWKVFISRAAPGTGNKDTYPHKILSDPFIGEPGSISTETYLCIGPLKNREEAQSVLSYLSCRLTRFLILLHKSSQDTTKKVYRFVPNQKWDKIWTDANLYEKYQLDNSEISFIENIVRPMSLKKPDNEN